MIVPVWVITHTTVRGRDVKSLRAVGATILNKKTKKGLPSAVVSCPASLGGKAVAVRRTFFDVGHSAAYCYWMIPASAHGAVLQVAVVATYQGAHVRRWFSARVG